MKMHVNTARLLSAGLIACCALAAAPLVHADVLDQLPGNTVAVLKFNHLGATNHKVADLMKTLGVTDFQPAMADPLAAIEKSSGLTQGINKSGDMAFAWINKPWKADQKDKAGHDVPPPLLVLVPVSDYKAFVDQNTVVKTDGDITVVHFKKETDNSYIAHWGDYAALSPYEKLLTGKHDGLKVKGLAARELTEKDACLYANLPLLRHDLLPMLAKGRAKLQDKVASYIREKRPQDVKKMPLVHAAVNQLVNIAQTFLQDCDGATVGWSLDKAGLNTTVISDFKPDSYLGKIEQNIKGTDGPLMAGLPDVKYMFMFGEVVNKDAATQLFNDLIGPIEKHFDVLDAQQQKMAHAMVDNVRTTIASLERVSFGMVAPTNTVGQGSLVQIVGIYKGDSQKLMQDQVEAAKYNEPLMKAFGLPNANNSKYTFTPDAKTVDGIKFNSMQVQIKMPGNTPQEMQQQQVINMMYGPNGITTLTGVVDPKTMLIVGGGDDQLLTTAISAAKANKPAISERDEIKAVDAELPKTRVAVGYVPLDEIVTTAVGYAKQFGFPMPVQLPPNLPPIGFTAGTEGSALRYDSHVPTQLIQSLIQAGMQVMLQMRGGHNGGGNGL